MDEPEYVDEEAEAAELEAARVLFEQTYHPIYDSQLAAGQVRPPGWLFEELLRSRSLTMISGEPFAGKSLFAMAMVASLRLGLPLAGAWQPAAEMPVLYIGQDSPQWDYQLQYQKLVRGMGGSLVGPQSVFLFKTGYSLLDPNFVSIVLEAQSLYGIEVVVLDTLLDFHDADENSNREMKGVMAVLRGLRDKHRLTIIVVHHTGKPQGGASPSQNYRPRGASVISGSVDQNVIISGARDGFKMRIPKRRGGTVPDAVLVRFVESVVEDKPALALVAEAPEAAYSQRNSVVLDALKAGPKKRGELIELMALAFPTWKADKVGERLGNTLRALKAMHAIEREEYGFWKLVVVDGSK